MEPEKTGRCSCARLGHLQPFDSFLALRLVTIAPARSIGRSILSLLPVSTCLKQNVGLSTKENHSFAVRLDLSVRARRNMKSSASVRDFIWLLLQHFTLKNTQIESSTAKHDRFAQSHFGSSSKTQLFDAREGVSFRHASRCTEIF